MASVLDCAMKYSELGLSVLPLHYPISVSGNLDCSCGKPSCSSKAKHPVGHLVPNGAKNASADPRLIERWFKNSPWNIGIATGRVSGIVAVDIDPRHDGDESLAALERSNEPLPPTWRFLTGGGGEHAIFRHPAGHVQNSAQKIAAGIDVRGAGGFIVAPPSRHIFGRPYAISVDHHPDDVPLADLPSWLMALIRNNPARGTRCSPGQEWRGLRGSAISEGQRNDTIARVTGHLLARKVDHHVCLDLMIAFNATHCTPPLSDEEVLAVVTSISRRELAKRLANRGVHRND